MKQLYFCRHGQSVLNLRQIYAGRTDTPLTDLGRQQAQTAGEHAKPLGIDLIVSSPLFRALETARIIAQHVSYPIENIVQNDLLKERALGSLEGKPFSTGPEDPSLFPDIETDTSITTRANAALDYLQSLEAKTILVVSHGSFLLVLQNIIKNESSSIELRNAEIVQVI